MRTGIQQAIRAEVEVEYEKKKQEIIADLDKKKDTVVAGIVVHMMKSTSFKMMGEILTIEIAVPKK